MNATFVTRWAVIAAAVLTMRPVTVDAAALDDVVPVKWEYKVLTRGQVEELGQKQFEVGLNRLGDDGWELVAVDPEPLPPPPVVRNKPAEYIFKRAKVVATLPTPDLKARLAQAEADFKVQQDRVAWLERMVQRAYVSDVQATIERARLESLRVNLEKLRKELEAQQSGGRDRQPPNR